MTVATKSPLDIVEATFVGALAIGSDPTSLALTSVEVAFAGRSNVGKSSLINTLVQRKGLVRTSGTPGCTRQINFFSVRARDGFSIVSVDLPGYGFAKRSKAERAEWADLIEGYLRKRPTLRLLVLLVDARRGLEDDDRELIEFVATGRAKGLQPVETIVVATKVDKLPKSRATSTMETVKKQARRPVIGFSSETRAGFEDLWRAIRRLVQEPEAPSTGSGAAENSA